MSVDVARVNMTRVDVAKIEIVIRVEVSKVR